MANWVGAAACGWSTCERLAAHVFEWDELFADDKLMPVLDQGSGRTNTAWLWGYVRGDRPWSGPEPPQRSTYTVLTAGRTAGRTSGTIQGCTSGRGHAGFEQRPACGAILLAACWAHTPSVDEDDAMYLLGLCGTTLSYLKRRGEKRGLIA